MPCVNKKSLREEFELLKGEFERLSNEGKVNSEVSALCRSMILLFGLLIAVFMEKKTRKNSRNSSKPSSQTNKDETSPDSGSKGKGKGQNGGLSENTRTVETIQVAKIENCGRCGKT